MEAIRLMGSILVVATLTTVPVTRLNAQSTANIIINLVALLNPPPKVLSPTGQKGLEPALTTIEIEILDIIKASKKPIYVRSGAIPQFIAAELNDRQKKENRQDWQEKKLLRVMTADVAPLQQVWFTHHAKTSVRVSQQYTEKPELAIIDESIVIVGFDCPETMEVIRDSELARICLAELKKDWKSGKSWRPKELDRHIKIDLAQFIASILVR